MKVEDETSKDETSKDETLECKFNLSYKTQTKHNALGLIIKIII